MKNVLTIVGISVILAGTSSGATTQFQLNILSVANTQPGQAPRVTFSVTDPTKNNAPYDIKTDPAFTSPSVSRINVEIGWDTVEFHNTGSGSEFASTPAAGQPLSLNVLSAAFSNGNGTFTAAFTQVIPSTATGTGMAVLDARAAKQDVTGAYSIAVPIKMTYQTFLITGTSLVARRQIVDRNRCNTCHTTLTVHGKLRTDELNACVVCHNPNATDIPYRQFGDGPEQPINFEFLVHSIHGGSVKTNPFQVIGFGHAINDFTAVRMSNPKPWYCEACHLPGTYVLPLSSKVLGTTVNTRSILTSTQKTVDNDPANNLRITPTAAVCSTCHDNQSSHITLYGGSFTALQQDITAGTIKEQCVNCHGPGKSKDVFVKHIGVSAAPRLSSLSVNSGLANSSVPVSIIGANLAGVTLQVAPAGVTASNVAIAGTQITAKLNVAANAAPGDYVITAVNSLGISGGLGFHVVPPAPVLTSITPGSGRPGGMLSVTLQGTNLTGSTLAAGGTAVAVSKVSATASTISATLTISATAQSGPVVLTATTAGGDSNGVVFNIDPAVPLPDFTISATPSSRTVSAGSSAGFNVGITALNGFAGTVGLSATGMPAGVTAVFNPTTVSVGVSSTLTLSTAPSTVAGTYSLTITATSGSLGHSTVAGLTVTPPLAGGSLGGSLTAPSATVQLTTEGTTDWAHWGLNTAADFSHKKGVASQIGNFSSVGGATAGRFTANPVIYSWSDGTPTSSASNVASGVYVSGQNQGFRIVVPAETTVRTLRVYIGLWRAQSKMVAHLSDGSSADYVDTSLTNTAGPVTSGVYTLTYSAASNGQTLTVTFTQTNATSGNVNLQAATLSGGTVVPDFTLAATPSTRSVGAGSGTTYTVTASALNGFSGSVGLTVSGTPPGATVGFNPASISGSGTSTLTVTTAAGTTAGNYGLTITGTSGALTHTANVTLSVIGVGSLTGAVASSPVSVALTTEDNADWAHWGLNAATDFNHKAAAVSQIGNFSSVAGKTAGRFTENPVIYSWTDGTPTTSASNVASGVYLSGVNQGFRVVVPADTTVRTLRIYVGVWRAQSKMVAHLSDGSAVDYIDASLVNTTGAVTSAYYTLTYRAASSGQTLTVTFTQTNATTGNVNLQAATLQ